MHYNYYLEQTKEIGLVEQIKYPMVFLSGLPGASTHEMVVFQSGKTGIVVSMDKDQVEVMLLDSGLVDVGSQVTRTNQKIQIGVGDELLGHVINPLGKHLFNHEKKFDFKQHLPIHSPAPGVPSRSRITKPFITGMAVVDVLLPLGKGQRELVVGDRKTGKTSFILSTIKTQAKLGSIIIYAGIGKRKTEIKSVKNFLEEEGIINQTVFVATSSENSPSLIYLTPYSAMTIAEYFCKQGNDVCIVFDDLSTHAKFYRELALLGRKFPGRESYPGDMFYNHARLLERAGNFKHQEKGDVSITALPVAETLEGDVRGYIVSNLISITDGHLLFSNSILNSGRHPAIDVFLSVTRVGKQTRGNLERQLSTEITALLTRFEKLENISHFGSEISIETTQVLAKGQKILSLFNQNMKSSIPSNIQLLVIVMIMGDFLNEKSTSEIENLRTMWAKQYHDDVKFKTEVDYIVSSNSLEEGMEKLKTLKI